MAKLDFSTFSALIGGIDKEILYDAVKPELQAYAEHRSGSLPIDQAYSLILEQSYRATGGEDPVPVIGEPVELVRRMGKGRDGLGKNYSAARVHVERIYYFFLFSDNIDPTAYGERISKELFNQSFFDEFARDLRRLGFKRPDYLPRPSIVKLGSVEISLGDAPDLLPFRLDWDESPKLVDEDGNPEVYAAMHWRSGLSQLHGRIDEYAKIWKWALDETKLVKTMLITGPGGAGKTRLAAEVVRNLVARKKWKGGFLLDGYEKNQGVYDGNAAGIVFVIDYPEEKTEAVRDILAAASNPVTYGKPIRIILVSRESRSSWLNILNKVKLDRFDDTPLDLKRYVSKDDALEIVSDIEAYYPDLIGRPKADFEGVGEWLDRDDTHRLPLNIIAASVHAVLDPSHAFNLDSAEVLTALAEWELRRVRYYSERDLGDRDCLEKLIGLSPFTQFGLTKETVFALGENGICPGKSGDTLLEAVQRTPFWNPKTVENPSHLIRLEPDRPAAIFCLKALTLDDPSPALPRWLVLPSSQDVDGFGDRLSRLIYDIGQVSPEASRSLEQVSIAMLELQPALIYKFQSSVHRKTSVFSAAFSADICRRLLSLPSDGETRSALLSNQSSMLSDLGQLKEALAAIEEALSIRRKLAVTRPELLPEVARSLNKLANKLSDLGRLEEALAASQEALTIFRQLTVARPEGFLPDLAMSLNNLTVMLSDIGQIEEALQTVNEAVPLYFQLAIAHPDAFLSELSTSLNNQSNILASTGLPEEALRSVEKAVAIDRRLSQARPDTFQSKLVMSLNNQSSSLGDLGRLEEALVVIEEAVSICRKLAHIRRDFFLPYLATTLTNQANRLSDFGRQEEALLAIKEAVVIRRKLAHVLPDSFRSDLAASLTTNAAVLIELRSALQALAVIEEAVDIRRQLAHARPGSVLPDLAASLNNKSIALADLGRLEEALSAIEETIAIRRQFSLARPKAMLADLTYSLNNRARTLYRLGRSEAALDDLVEAISLLCPGFLQKPTTHRTWMHTLVRLYYFLCSQTSRDPDMCLLKPILDLLEDDKI